MSTTVDVDRSLADLFAQGKYANIKEHEKLHPDLPGLLVGLAGGAVNSDLDDYMGSKWLSKAGTAKGRSVASGTKAKEEAKFEPEALTIGDGKYLRPNGDLYFSRKWGEHEDVAVLRKAREISSYIMLYGAPGTGKTALCEGAFGLDLVVVLGTGDTEVADLVGGYVTTPSGGFEWVDGPLLYAAENGLPILFDEVGLIDPKVMSVVYSLMDGRRELRVTANPERGTVKAKDGFYVIGATNPNAPGVNLSEALLSRFNIHAEMTTDWALARKLGVPADAVKVAKHLDGRVNEGVSGWGPQFRELLAFRDTAASFGTDWAIQNLIAAAPEIDRPIVAQSFEATYGKKFLAARI